PAKEADTFLPIEHRSRAIELDGPGDHDHQGQGECEQRASDGQIGRSLKITNCVMLISFRSTEHTRCSNARCHGPLIRSASPVVDSGLRSSVLDDCGPKTNKFGLRV